jgi:hypothetical protein
MGATPPLNPTTALPGQKIMAPVENYIRKKGLQKKIRIVTITLYGHHLNIFAAPI